MDTIYLPISVEDLLFYFIMASAIILMLVIYIARRRRREDFIEAATALGFLSTTWISSDIYSSLVKFRLYNERSMLNPGPVVQTKLYGYNLSIVNVKMIWMKANERNAVTVAHVRLHDQKFPDFSLESPTVLVMFNMDRLDNRIAFSEHPEFSKLFWLKGENEQAIRDFFTPQRIAFFEQKRKKYFGYGLKLGPVGLGGRFPCLETRGNEFIFFFESKAIAPKKLSGFINETIEIMRCLTGQSN